MLRGACRQRHSAQPAVHTRAHDASLPRAFVRTARPGDELDGNEFDDLQNTIEQLGLCDVERGYCTKGRPLSPSPLTHSFAPCGLLRPPAPGRRPPLCLPAPFPLTCVLTSRLQLRAGDFALAMLIRQDKCTAADVQMAIGTFEKLDADGSGEVSRGEAPTPDDRRRPSRAHLSACPLLRI